MPVLDNCEEKLEKTVKLNHLLREKVVFTLAFHNCFSNFLNNLCSVKDTIIKDRASRLILVIIGIDEACNGKEIRIVITF